MSVSSVEARSVQCGGAAAGRLPSLTGLRFVAAFGVFAYHVLGLVVVPGMLRPLLMAGQAGVSFFFVLSGFVLTWSFRSGESATDFWRRRVARIVPSHAVTWLIGIPVVAWRFGAWPHAVSLFATAGLVQSWIPDRSVFFGVNGVAWSLSCEAFFYALFPILMPLVRRSRHSQRALAMCGCVAMLAAIQLLGWLAAGDSISDSSGAAFWLISVLPLSRLPEFVFGMLAAQTLRERPRQLIPMPASVLLVVGAAYLAGLFPTAVVAGWLTIVPFGLLLSSAAAGDLGSRRRWLAASKTVRLGEWSFAFYLCHQLVLRLVDRPWPDGRAWPLQVSVDLALAVAASAFLYRRVEVPFERRLRPRRTAVGVR